MDKSKMRDPATGNYITQGLFLEHQYDVDRAIYTLKDEDYEYQGKTFLSLKKLYLEEEDVVEYEFANKYLCGWKHWQRICNNKLFTALIEEWRMELEIKIRGKAVRGIMKDAEKGHNASKKWLADRGWEKRARGRPSKADVQHETEVAAGIAAEYKADVERIH